MNRKHAFTERLSTLQSWRYGLRTQISRLQSVMNEHQFLDVTAHNQLLTLLKRVNDERITIAFVAEPDRGDFELINCLFLSDLKRALLPAHIGTRARCVTQIRFDPTRPTSIRLLPIESRESPRRLTELIGDENEWRTVNFDAHDATSTAKALAALGETRRISLADAVSWGVHVDALRERSDARARDGDADMQSIDVPRWRHAIINLAHPLFDAGLVILDVPGHATLATEPEIRREWLPAADAVISVISLADGLSKIEQTTWREYLGAPRATRDRMATESKTSVRLVAANRIDQLKLDEDASMTDRLREISRRTDELADLLRLDARFVVAVSSSQGLVGSFGGDQDALIRSRLYQLERAIAANLTDEKQRALSDEIITAMSTLISDAQAVLDSERYDTLEGLNVLTGLHEKSERLTQTVEAERNSQRSSLDDAHATVRALKPVHTKLTHELAALVSAGTTLADIAAAKSKIAASLIPSATSEAVDTYFATTHQRVEALARKIDEIRLLFGNAGEQFSRSLEIGHFEVHPFATQRFDAELTKIREAIDGEFATVSSLKLKRGAALAQQFEAIARDRVVRLFAIAERESGSWMRGILTSIERPLAAAQQKLAERSARCDKMLAAQMEVSNKLADLQARLDVINRKHKALTWLRESLARWLNGVEEDETPLG